MNVYLLDVDVYRDADETDWIDGIKVVFETQAGAYSYFKAWVDGREYAVDTRVHPAEHFIGGDEKAFDADGAACFMSWGINMMEVQA